MGTVEEYEILSYNIIQKRVIPDRPWITLTYAQSLDGFISIPGKQLLLSGNESLILTHAIRQTRDAILIGVATVLCDKPSLTTRFIKSDPSTVPFTPKHPRPIIVDTNLKCPIDSFQNRNPIILTKKHEDPTVVKRFQNAGFTIVELPLKGTHINLAESFLILKSFGIDSIMVEGGAKIIQEFVNSKELPVDELIVTIAPVYVKGGIHSTCTTNSILNTSDQITNLKNPKWHSFGNDVVLTGLIEK
ncbi:dihydrofolate reductase-like domain-containing protein [Globomyces pollinis-pini]|nr:dihydrofolate reductase-like domain-containing protein [Globomyces pollinis-pini]